MKLRCIKYFFLIVFFFFFFGVAKAHAASPDVYGYIYSQNGAPVNDVWVKWVDVHNDVRYVQSGHSYYNDCPGNPNNQCGGNPGEYYFRSWQSPQVFRSEQSNPIVVEGESHVMGYVVPGLPFEDSGFGCDQNPHAFSVVPSKNYPGTFVPVVINKNFAFPNPSWGNETNSENIGNFVYVPPAGSPTPTPTPKNMCKQPCNPGNADRDCQGTRDTCTVCAPDGKGSGICKPPAVCGAECDTTDYCLKGDAGNTCTVCALDAKSGKKICQPPPPTPTPTPTPFLACNQPCSPGNADRDCQGTKDGCTVCGPNQSGGNTCQPPPACNVSCTTSAFCQKGTGNNCTECLPSPSGTGKTCQPNPFNTAMCKCESIESSASQFLPDTKTTFTMFGKVEGADTNWAQIRDVQFQVFKNDLTNRLADGDSGFIPMNVIESSPTRVRYKGSWDYTVPAQTPGTKVIVQGTMTCVKKSQPTASNFSAIAKRGVTRAVLAGATGASQPKPWCSFADWVPGCSAATNPGGSSNRQSVTPTPSTPQTLQLDSFSSGTVISSACPQVVIAY